MMTRSLAENYPYSRVYKAEIRGPHAEWIEIVESIESGILPAKSALAYLLSLLMNHSSNFVAKADKVIKMAENFRGNFDKILKLLINFFTSTTYSSRAFEVVIHCFLQAYMEMDFASGVLEVLSQMRSANKKHGNIGDIEIKYGNMIIESWDAKYGKPYLRDELEELADKLETHPNVEVAGFIVDSDIKFSTEIHNRVEEIEQLYDCRIFLYSFSEWISYKIEGISNKQLSELGKRWLVAVAESFGQKRQHMAPIDEPCDGWLDTLLALLSDSKYQ